MVQQNIVQDRLQDLFPVHYRNGNILMINADCMDVMAHIQDNEAELSCVDPPYGLGILGYGKESRERIARGDIKGATFDTGIPNKEYFNELFRVSKNQIICGGNYFELPPCRGYIVWDKGLGEGVDFSDSEYLWTSFDRTSKTFRYNPFLDTVKGRKHGSQNPKNPRIHPTQKPVALYKWLLSRYAKPGDRILDTHGGSGSICIACHDLGYDLTWMELDADYYEAACKRYKDYAAQAVLFEPQEIRQKTYNNEFDLTS
jgi:site-specific DNA-methyltransferase (adenine-specific)